MCWNLWGLLLLLIHCTVPRVIKPDPLSYILPSITPLQPLTSAGFHACEDGEDLARYGLAKKPIAGAACCKQGDQLPHMRGCLYSGAFYFLDGQNNCFPPPLPNLISCSNPPRSAPPASIWQVNVALNTLVCILTSLQGAFNCVTLMD